MIGTASPSDRTAATDSAHMRFHDKQGAAAAGAVPIIRPYDQNGLIIASAVEIPRAAEATAADAGMESFHYWTMFPPASKVFVRTTKNQYATREVRSQFRRDFENARKATLHEHVCAADRGLFRAQGLGREGDHGWRLQDLLVKDGALTNETMDPFDFSTMLDKSGGGKMRTTTKPLKRIKSFGSQATASDRLRRAGLRARR